MRPDELGGSRVAVDLLGGDGTPAAVVDGVLAALTADTGLRVILVGPPEGARRLLDAAFAARLAGQGDVRDRLSLAPATQVIGMDEDPARAARAKRDATVRVAAQLLRDGEADAMVSVGSTGAAMAAALFTLGRLHGTTRPALAITLPAGGGDLVLLDVGANIEATPDLLAQHALAGAAYARVRLGFERPRVGLLTVGEEAGKGDLLRKEAHTVLGALPIEFVGNVEGGDVPLGGVADVVVTDGFTGNVLLKGLEGALSLLTNLVASGPAATAFVEATAHLQPEQASGAVLLGVDGIVVIGHGRSSAGAVASCISQAAQSVRDGLLPGLRASLESLVAYRRQEAGLPVLPAVAP